MVSLLDVNTLVALAWPNHIHHEPAHAWFSEHRGEGWATCPVTESGFVRVSSNPATTPGARSPREAAELLRRIVGLPGHRFWSDDVSPARADSPAWELVLGHRQVTDAHLLALALRREGRLATFERGVLALLPETMDPSRAVALIPLGS